MIRANIRRAIRYMKPDWPFLLWSTICAVAGASVAPLPTLIIRELIDGGFAGTSRYSLPALLIAFSVIPFLGMLFSFGRLWGATKAGQRLICRLRSHVYERLHQKTFGFFITRPSGEILARTLSNSEAVNSLPERLLSALFTLLTAFSILVTAFFMNWQLSLILLCTVPLIFLPTPFLARMLYKLSRHTNEKLEALMAFLNQSLSLQGIQLAKTMGTSEEEQTRFHALQNIFARAVERGITWKLGHDQVTAILVTVPSILLFWAAASSMGRTLGLTAGTVMAYASFFNGIYGPFQTISRLGGTFRTLEATFERIFEYVDAPEDMPDRIGAINTPIRGDLAFEEVSFTYPDSEQGVKAISFSVRPNQAVAIVGPSGSGKSTVALLLSRLYEHSSGHILLDGRDIRSWSRSAVARQIGIVTQEPYLFYGTIRENIAYGSQNATEEEITNAARLAHIHDFVMNLPKKYDTHVGERGYTLSGGEKQRLALARQFLRNPHILILDEATSALDSLAEAEIRSALERLTEGRTTLIITHRLTSLPTVQEILVMNGGRIVERGTKAELLNAGGLFALMYNQQANTPSQPSRLPQPAIVPQPLITKLHRLAAAKLEEPQPSLDITTPLHRGGHPARISAAVTKPRRPDMNSQVMLSVQGLRKVYKAEEHEVRALAGVTLDIYAGEFVAVMGPSGSGKSTLLQMMGGLDQPSSGTVNLGGEILYGKSDDELTALRRRHIGFVFQQYHLIPVLNARENVALPLTLAGLTVSDYRDRISSLLAKVGLTARQYHFPAQLSGGEQQRVAIARSLIMEPTILLGDEPTGALDVKTGHSIMQLLSRLNEGGQTIVVVTHDVNVAAYADRVVFLRDGAVADQLHVTADRRGAASLILDKLERLVEVEGEEVGHA